MAVGLNLREWLVPNDKAFFDLLEQESANVVEGAHGLQEMVDAFDNLEERKTTLKNVEHKGDDIVHTIYERVNETFITPIDQDDITKLASLYDDVLDYMYAVANCIKLYELKEPTSPMKELARLVRQSVDAIHAAFLAMRHEDRAEIDKRCIEVDSYENEADVVMNDAIASLFKGSDVISIIKLKEIYEQLEMVTDKCEDVSQVLRDIVRRYG
jgi:uncharacterized protein